MGSISEWLLGYYGFNVPKLGFSRNIEKVAEKRVNFVLKWVSIGCKMGVK